MTVESTFDSLFLIDGLEASASNGSGVEVQTLAYLSCLVAVYDGRPAQWWGYSFTATKAGAPYATEIAKSLDDLVHTGFVAAAERTLSLTDRGREELEFSASLPLNDRRVPYLDAASAAALTMPLPSVSDALSFEPGLRRALRFVKTRSLLDEAGLALLEGQFRSLAAALEGNEAAEDLLVPTVVWLTYLATERPADRGVA